MKSLNVFTVAANGGFFQMFFYKFLQYSQENNCAEVFFNKAAGLGL